MALPFILGLAVGAGAVIAFKNKDNLKEKGAKLFEKSKDLANTTLEKTKENVSELKNSICPMKKIKEENIELKNKEEE